jgi:RNA polymerase sigma factor (sigma-70 family)
MTEKEYNINVNLYADNVYRFILKNLRNPEEAKDIVQTAFERLWKNREAVENEKCKAYLFTVAYNLMIDFIRKNKRVNLKEDFEEDVKVEYQKNSELQKILQRALLRLNEIQRSLIMLKDYEGYSYAEIATITSLNESQVKVYLHRARLILKEYLVSKENVN